VPVSNRGMPIETPSSSEPDTPEWVRHAVFYQIFPDRFGRANTDTDLVFQSSTLEAWDSPPTPTGYKGGNLPGIRERLDYLQGLGITALYLTPVFQSPANHRYHTHDYYQIDPLLGGRRAFDALLSTLHERGMRLVLDGVFNHVGRGFFFFNDVLENGEKSPWVDWFRIKRWPLYAYDRNHRANYACWYDNPALPQFNHNNPAVREYIMRIAEYWLGAGIDGWRLDVPHHVTAPGFWQEFRQRVKSVNPEAYLVGEIFKDASQWLDGSQFDGVMNYPFAVATILFAVDDRCRAKYLRSFGTHEHKPLSAEEYAARISHLLGRYPWNIQLSQYNLLNSHDTARLYTLVDGDEDVVKLAALLLFTFPGAPSIYYGDEVGLPGAPDPDCRRSFPPSSEWQEAIFACYQQLVSLRHRYAALRIGRYKALWAQAKSYVFCRCLDHQNLIIAVNAGREGTSVSLTDQIVENLSSPTLLYGVAQLNWTEAGNSKRLVLELPPKSGVVIGTDVS
jgi:cyclomaltodextrinase